MRRFPSEFEALLTDRGRRILAGSDPAVGAIADPARPFVTLSNVIDPVRAAGCRALLEKHLLEHLEPMEQPIPDEAIGGMKRNYAELLPKTARVWTAYLDHRRARSYRIAEELGLVAMLESESCTAFAAAIAGRPLKRKKGVQVLCYGPGDYAGPHNDHHPEEPDARAGYVDLHVSLPTEAVGHQWLVYAKDGHFSEITSVANLGGVNVYRLPFWHYTTPLASKPGLAADARRWLLLATHLFAPPRATPKTAVFPAKPS